MGVTWLAAFAETFLLASRISNLILQAAEEHLQACTGMTEWAIYARSSVTVINVLTNEPAEKEGWGHAENKFVWNLSFFSQG